MSQIIKSKSPAWLFLNSDEIQNLKGSPKTAVLLGFMQFGYKNHSSKMVLYWTITPVCSIKEWGSEITFFCSVQGWLSQGVQWNTTQSHLQPRKLSKENVKNQKTFLFLSTSASDLTCIHYAKPVSLKFSDSVCDLLHILEVLTGCSGSNTSYKFLACTKRSFKYLKFDVKNNKVPKTRTQQGFPFIGCKYPWLSKGYWGIAQSSVQQHGIWKTCAQLTDWQQPRGITKWNNQVK